MAPIIVNSCPSNIDNQLPGNIGTGIRSDPIVKIEKKAIINKPFKSIPSLSNHFFDEITNNKTFSFNCLTKIHIKKHDYKSILNYFN